VASSIAGIASCQYLKSTSEILSTAVADRKNSKSSIEQRPEKLCTCKAVDAAEI